MVFRVQSRLPIVKQPFSPACTSVYPWLLQVKKTSKKETRVSDVNKMKIGSDSYFLLDTVILPPSALATLTRLQIEFPMLFAVLNPLNSKKTHCGVMEFTAPEGIVYMPYWVSNCDDQLYGWLF